MPCALHPAPCTLILAPGEDSDFGLTASGWTRSTATADRLQRELDAGLTVANTIFHDISWPSLRDVVKSAG